MTHRIPLIALLLAAACGSPSIRDSDTGEAPEDTGERWRHECTDPAPLPVSSTLLEGFTGAEDFSFDADGYLVSIDLQGNLVAIDQAGDKKVILPAAGEFTSGMHMLLDGSFVFSDAWTGTLMRAWPSGASEAVLSGLMYPNGLEVDREGFIYVTEHDAARVRRVDPENGESEIIATGIHNANGVQFSTDYETLYVGSFGGGMVHSVQRLEGGAWGPPELLGMVPTVDAESIPVPCEGLADGDACLRTFSGIGECTDVGGGELECAEDLDQEACAGLERGDPCTSDFLGYAVESACRVDEATDALFCPRTSAPRIQVCDGATHWASCRVEGQTGSCVPSWEGVLMCFFDSDWNQYQRACDEALPGDACTVLDPRGPFEGACEHNEWWGESLMCSPWYGWGEIGGLDGIGVDACDNIYVTEYVTGVIYRFTPEGDVVEVVQETGAFWIPNMHWGNGVGGWDPETLYVLDREAAAVHALEVDVLGSREAYEVPVAE